MEKKKMILLIAGGLAVIGIAVGTVLVIRKMWRKPMDVGAGTKISVESQDGSQVASVTDKNEPAEITLQL